MSIIKNEQLDSIKLNYVLFNKFDDPVLFRIYHNINGAFILYDITKHETFEKVQTYIVDIIGNIGTNVSIILIGFLKEEYSFG